MYKAIANPNPSKWAFPVGSDAFLVVDDDGKVQATTFPTLEQAQKRADVLNSPDDDIYGDFFDSDTAIDYFANRGEQQQAEKSEAAPEKQVVFASGPHKVGDLIQDGKHTYRVTKESYYVSPADAATIEDGWDAVVEVGWHTPAELVEEGS